MLLPSRLGTGKSQSFFYNVAQQPFRDVGSFPYIFSGLPGKIQQFKGRSGFSLTLLQDPEAEIAMKQNLRKDYKTALLKSTYWPIQIF
jgi:hypothetical protein